MRVRRTVQAAGLLVVVLLATVAGVATAGFGTRTGELLLTDFAIKQLTNLLQGVASVGSIEGSVTTGLVVRDLEVHDDSGVVFVELPELRVQYRLLDLMLGRIVLGRVELDSPTVNVYKLPNGRFNYQEVLGLGGNREGEGAGGPPPLVSFRNAEIRNATVIIHTPSAAPGPDDRFTTEMYRGRLMRLRRLDSLSALVSHTRIVSPFPGENGLQFDIDRLSTRMSDPELDIRNLRGRLEIDGRTMTLDLDTLRLPRSNAAVAGTLRWPAGRLLLGLEIDARRWSVDDVRGLVKVLPWGMEGRGRLSLRSLNADSLRIRAAPIALAAPGGGGALRGTFGALVSRGLRELQSTDLTFDSLRIEYLRPLIDTIPFTGRLSGSLVADGPLDLLDLDVDWQFVDSLVPGRPVSDVRGRGAVSLGEDNEFVFFNFGVDSADLALATVERMFPVVGLQGRLGGVGRLNGDWRNVEFTGRMAHRDGTAPMSRALGTLRLDSRRDTVGIFANLVMDSLDFAGVHRSYPGLPGGGVMGGRVTVSGYTDSLSMQLEGSGELGTIAASAEFVLLPGLIVVRNVEADLIGVNLGPTHERLLPTELYGRITGGMVTDSLAPPRGRFGVALDTSFVSGSAVDSVRGSVAFADSVFRADDLAAWGPRYQGTVSGSFGLGGAAGGELLASLDADSVGVLDSLLLGLFPQVEGEEFLTGLDGATTLAFGLRGGVGRYTARLDLEVPDLGSQGGLAEGIEVHAQWGADPTDSLSLAVRIDSLAVGEYGYGDLALTMEGARASPTWLARARIGEDASWISWGQAFADERVTVLMFDSTRVLMPNEVWNLERVALVSVSDSGYVFSNFDLATLSRSARIGITGVFPRSGRASLRATVDALPASHVWALLQRDPRSVDGEIGGTLVLGGTAADPEFDAGFALDQGRIGSVRIPYLQGTTRYEWQRLTGAYSLIQRGDSILSVDFSLPLDLALEDVAVRRLDDTLSINAVATGADLGFMEFITPSVQEATGAFDADFGVRGGWDNPVLRGYLAVRNGAARFPALGVRHQNLGGRVVLSGDTVYVDQFSVESGGTATVSGYVRLAGLREPILDLRIVADAFDTIDIQDFMTFESTGEVAVSGPVFGATLTGTGTLSDGVLYFADLIEKDIINLEDTLGIGSLVAADLIAREGLRADFENRFLDSLTIDALQLTMGRDVWLRSSEANIQLEGLLQVDKVGDRYRYDGTLTTPRGTYRLPFSNSEFNVTGGEVQYFGTPDLNAAVDIDTRTEVSTVRGDRVNVFANIGGTLYQPQIALTSDIQPPIPESEIISYLVFRAPSVEALAGASGGNSGAVQLGAAASLLSGQVFSQLERTLISDLGVPISYLQIRPGSSLQRFRGTQISVGFQLGEDTFVTLNPRLCGNENIARDLLYPGLDYRFSTAWRLSFSIDPAAPCVSFGRRFNDVTTQVGADLFWEKRY